LSAPSSFSNAGVRSTADASPALRCGCVATQTLSRQESRVNSRMFWNVRVMPPQAMRFGLIPEMGFPSNVMRPWVGV
jgi:hypothetical protein